MNTLVDSIDKIPVDASEPPAQMGQMETFNYVFNKMSGNLADSDSAPSTGSFGLLKKAGVITLLFLLLSWGMISRLLGTVLENPYIRKSVIALIFFIITFVCLKWM